MGATERGCSGSIGSDDTRGYGAGSGDVGKELPRGMIPGMCVLRADMPVAYLETGS